MVCGGITLLWRCSLGTQIITHTFIYIILSGTDFTLLPLLPLSFATLQKYLLAVFGVLFFFFQKINFSEAERYFYHFCEWWKIFFLPTFCWNLNWTQNQHWNNLSPAWTQICYLTQDWIFFLLLTTTRFVLRFYGTWRRHWAYANVLHLIWKILVSGKQGRNLRACSGSVCFSFLQHNMKPFVPTTGNNDVFKNNWPHPFRFC